ncbi:hypothetical protein CPB83DRAFT_885684 [Crepidotus variabilis]|uniref:MYND-type domain-containing protein n=1 Tax=Crepidotus variabilis TaxID=179855 RepID=A0A9P6JLG2_9AGAR|nr:hypothetical protein CPB83DRAFT_885684 [Crepidotus variabilis]
MSAEDWKATCNYCLKEGTRDSVGACSGCKLVRYCSKECQRKAWPTHKRGCIRMGASLLQHRAENPAADDLNNRLSKWINFWRSTIFYIAPVALDLPNHGEDRMATHVFSLFLDTNDDARNPANYFSVSSGAILTRQQVCDSLREAETAEEHITDWEEDRRGSNTIQIFIHAEGYARFLYASYTETDLQRRRSVPKDTSTQLVEGWEAAFIATVESGELPDDLKRDYSNPAALVPVKAKKKSYAWK